MWISLRKRYASPILYYIMSQRWSVVQKTQKISVNESRKAAKMYTNNMKGVPGGKKERKADRSECAPETLH